MKLPQSLGNSACPSSITPARLAVGLEAKKSSAFMALHPVFYFCKTLVPPCCFHNFGDINLSDSLANGKRFGKKIFRS